MQVKNLVSLLSKPIVWDLWFIFRQRIKGGGGGGAMQTRKAYLLRWLHCRSGSNSRLVYHGGNRRSGLSHCHRGDRCCCHRCSCRRRRQRIAHRLVLWRRRSGFGFDVSPSTSQHLKRNSLLCFRKVATRQTEHITDPS